MVMGGEEELQVCFKVWLLLTLKSFYENDPVLSVKWIQSYLDEAGGGRIVLSSEMGMILVTRWSPPHPMLE